MGIQERKEREKEQRKEAILDAAQHVFFGKGLSSATMDEIAEAAELSKGTLYLYYKSKEDLYVAVMMRGMNLLHGLVEGVIGAGEPAVKSLFKLTRVYAQFFHEYRDYFRMMNFLQTPQLHRQVSEEVRTAADELNHRTWNAVIRVIKQGIAEGLISDKLDPMELTVILWSSATSLMLRIDMQFDLFKETMHLNLEQTLDRSNRLFLDAILTEKGRRELAVLTTT